MLIQLCLFIENFFYIYKYLGSGKRSILFSLQFHKFLEWYFHQKKSLIGEKKIDYLSHVAHLRHGLQDIVEILSPQVL